MNKIYDFTVIGGGIVGSNIAKQLSKYGKQVALVEKESKLGMHASTRNSAVLHAGIYYASDSLKAKLCKNGNEQLTQYINENNLPVKNTGKYIVASDDKEYEVLKLVREQAIKNTIEIEWIPIKEALKREPHLRLVSENYNVIYAPHTKVACHFSIMEQLSKDIANIENIDVFSSSKFEKFDQHTDTLVLNQNDKQINLKSNFVINTGGLYADKIAQEFGFCKDYSILPLKGSYLKSSVALPELKSLVYPVPPIQGRHTVLGVHLTQTMDDHIKLGPNAIPSLWREQYSQNLENFQLEELKETLTIYAKNFFNSSSRGFYINHAVQELKKMNKQVLIDQAKRLTTVFDDRNDITFEPVERTGIRAQLIENSTRLPVNDFIIESDYKKSLHMLNLASPGWTCSIPMATHVCDKLKENGLLN